MSRSIKKSVFGKTSDGVSVEKFRLQNSQNMIVDIITYGGRITSVKVPDADGVYKNVVLGHDNLRDYEEDSFYLGALIGRYANRIAKGKFTLDSRTYGLATNNGENHLHGGNKGFDKVVWKAEVSDNTSLKLSYLSRAGEEGYPGNLKATVIYTLTDDNVLEVDYEATTDKTTLVNLTQHSYFNLSGNFSKPILQHYVKLHAEYYLPIDEAAIPIGETRKVENTAFDFRISKPIGRDIDSEDEQLKRGKGYDHCWVLQGNGMRPIATAYDQSTGRYLEVLSDTPGVQLYTGNFLKGLHKYRTGFCLETQYFPDSPNRPDFPSAVLKPGGTYKTKTAFRFGVNQQTIF